MQGDRNASRATLFVMVGLPGAGKTTLAREIEERHRALRFTPDEWMIPLFGQPEGDGTRDVLEGRFVWLALRALQLGVNVVVDFGCWSKDERTALRALAESVGTGCEIVYVHIDEPEQRRRLAARSPAVGTTAFQISEPDLAAFRKIFEPPDEAELLVGGEIGTPPPGYDSWVRWAAERWPTSGA